VRIYDSEHAVKRAADDNDAAAGVVGVPPACGGERRK
jgi:hypothetical protein